MAKRKKKPAATKKPVKKKKASATPRKRTPAKKQSEKPKDAAKRGGAAEPSRAAGRAGSATLPPPTRPRTTTHNQRAGGTARELVTSSDPDTTVIDAVRALNNADRVAVGSCPMQTGEHAPPTNAVQLAKNVAENEDRLEGIAPDLVDANKDEVLRKALWWAGTARLPRAAIVGLALHELESFTEEFASKRGTAVAICVKIHDRNAAHLRVVTRKALQSKQKQERIDAALVGHLNKAWAVLEKLDLLRAAPRAGVYLIGRGEKVFKGFPQWTDVDEPWPKKPTRPSKRPRS